MRRTQAFHSGCFVAYCGVVAFLFAMARMYEKHGCLYNDENKHSNGHSIRV